MKKIKITAQTKEEFELVLESFSKFPNDIQEIIQESSYDKYLGIIFISNTEEDVKEINLTGLRTIKSLISEKRNDFVFLYEHIIYLTNSITIKIFSKNKISFNFQSV